MLRAFPSIIKKNTVTAQSSILLFSLVIFLVPFLLPHHPAIKYISVLVRYNNTRFLPILTLVLFFVLSLKNNLLSKLLTALIIFPICAFALIGLWASMYTETNVITGTLPRMDALSYYTSAMSLLENGTLVGHTQRRPLFGGMVAVLLWIFNRDLQLVMVAFTYLSVLALYLTLYKVRHMLGPIAAVIFFIPQFLYYRMYIGNIMSETLGFYLGLVSFLFFMHALDLAKIKKKASINHFIVATFLFTLAQLARPGALLTIPLLALFSGWYFAEKRNFSIKSFLVICLAILIAYGLNRFMFAQLTAGNSSQYNNSGYGLYGVVAGGKSWAQIMVDYPGVVSLPPGLREREIFKVIAREFVAHPENFFKGMLLQFGYIFSLVPIHHTNIYAYMQSTSKYLDSVLIGLYYLLSILGLINIIQNRKKTFSVFITILLAGFILSLPIAPAYQSGYMRYYPATIPLLGILPAMGMSWVTIKVKYRNKSLPTNNHEEPLRLFIWVIGLSVVVLLLGPFLLILSNRPDAYDAKTCLPGESQLILPFYSNSGIRIETITDTWAPNISEEDFRKSVLNIPHVPTKNFFRKMPTPLYIFPSLNLINSGIGYVIMDVDEIPVKSTILLGCGTIQDVTGKPSDSGFFYPRFLEITSD